MYQVIVGNIGTVRTCEKLDDAVSVFQEYSFLSESDYGRAAGEDVTLFDDDWNDIKMEFTGKISRNQGDD